MALMKAHVVAYAIIFLLNRVNCSINIINVSLNLAELNNCGCIYFVHNSSAANKFDVIPKNFMFYRTSSFEKLKNLQSFPCDRPLFVSYLMFWKQEMFDQIFSSKLMIKSIWVFINDKNLPFTKTLKDSYIKINSKVLVASLIDGIIHFDVLYRVSQERSIIVENYGRWTPMKGMEIKTENRRTDLMGIKMVTGTNVIRGDAETVDPPEYFLRLWLVLADSLNISTTIEWYKNLSVGGYQGGKWSGLIGLLLNKEIDVVATEVNINNERFGVIDFAETMLTTNYEVYMQTGGFLIGWTNPWKPFNFGIWLVILLWVLVGGACIELFAYFSVQNGERSELDSSITFILRSLSQQGSDQVPQKHSLRLIFLTGYILSSILLPAYSASLISWLTMRTPVVPFRNLQELFNGNYRILVNLNTADYNFFTTSKEKIHQDIVKHRLEVLNFTDRQKLAPHFRMLNLACKNHSFGFLSGAKMAEYYEFKSNRDDCDIVTMDHRLSVIHQSIGFRPGFQYLQQINKRILQMRESGIANRFSKLSWRRKRKGPREQFAEITLPDTIAIFAILLAGLLLSLIILLCELCLNNMKIRRKAHSL